ncbi:MAG: type 4a pilus biogenesis protein PilO [Candidatus Omnitrophota bacterium]
MNRKKLLIISIAVVLGGLAAYSLVGQGFYSEQKKAKAELRKIEDEASKTRDKFPDIKAEERELSELQKSYDGVLKDIASYEQKIPSAGSVSKLLGEMTRRSEGLGMDFESIKQNIEREKEGYLILKLDMKFSGPYASAVNYLNRLQNVSDYLTVPNIEISQTKESAPLSKTSMQVSMLLLEKGMDLGALDGAQATEPIILKSDPFVSKRAGGKDRSKDFKLSGITQAGKESTAIINDEVVKVGAKIGEWKVVKILPDAVTLSDGAEDVSVTLNR